MGSLIRRLRALLRFRRMRRITRARYFLALAEVAGGLETVRCDPWLVLALWESAKRLEAVQRMERQISAAAVIFRRYGMAFDKDLYIRHLHASANKLSTFCVEQSPGSA